MSSLHSSLRLAQWMSWSAAPRHAGVDSFASTDEIMTDVQTEHQSQRVCDAAASRENSSLAARGHAVCEGMQLARRSRQLDPRQARNTRRLN